MPNGYRVGGSYTRNGKTFTRRGTSIARPGTKLAVVGVAVGAVALFGTGSALTVTVAAVGIAAVIGYRYRRPIRCALRPLRPVGRKVRKRFEVFNPIDGQPIKTVRTERAAKRATAGNGRDYAPQGESWPPHPEAVLKNPDTWWKTGGEPVTENQRYTLRALGIDATGLSKAEASRRIGAAQEAKTDHDYGSACTCYFGERDSSCGIASHRAGADVA